MALYTFYPCKADGGSEAFLTFDLRDDDDAYARALYVLDQHRSATHVAVWCADRKVTIRKRVHADLQGVLTRPTVEGQAS